MQNEELIRPALENGADKAQVIAQQQIVMSPVFREICESNGCGNYGKCRLCATCAKRDGQPCRHPDDALPSLESYGIDVYHTAKDTALRYINGENTVTYFGMVLFGECAPCRS